MGSTASVLPIERGSRLFVELACGPEDVHAAQALRFKVFGEEMGAQLKREPASPFFGPALPAS